MKVLVVISLLFLSGCAVIWTDDCFVATVGKRFNMNEIGFRSDPNSLQIGGKDIQTSNDKIKAITPYGAVETK